MPVILRNRVSAEFVGEAYMHGIMSGEAMDALNEEIGKAVEFELQ